MAAYRDVTSRLDGLDPEIVEVSDPLNADGAVRRLPEMNAATDLNGLVGTLRTLLPEPAALAGYGPEQCLAAMRDLGMFLGSVKRHGTEPTELVPEVVPVLLELGRRTDMVPRDTVHHYTLWNPPDRRRRTYVHDDQEHTLQDSVRMVLPHMRQALELCDVLTRADPRDPVFPAAMGELVEHVGTMAECMDLVSRKVSPVFFAQVLRPYFEEITVDGDVLLGPAAAQVPLWLVDLVTWASDRGEREYEEFLRDSVRYSLPRWRGYYRSWVPRPSMVTRLVDAFEDAPPSDADTASGGAVIGSDGATLRDSATMLTRLLRTVTVFRGRHLSLARRAYHVDVRRYPTGSGGGDVELLNQILSLTRDASGAVRRTSGAPAVRVPDRSAVECGPG